MEFPVTTLHQYTINDVGSNYFGDAKYLSECYLPEVKEVTVYGTWEENNQFAEHGFPSKL